MGADTQIQVIERRAIIPPTVVEAGLPRPQSYPHSSVRQPSAGAHQEPITSPSHPQCRRSKTISPGLLLPQTQLRQAKPIFQIHDPDPGMEPTAQVFPPHAAEEALSDLAEDMIDAHHFTRTCESHGVSMLATTSSNPSDVHIKLLLTSSRLPEQAANASKLPEQTHAVQNALHHIARTSSESAPSLLALSQPGRRMPCQNCVIDDSLQILLALAVWWLHIEDNFPPILPSFGV